MKTKSGLRLGISLPQNFPEEKLDHAYLRDYVLKAESLGFEDGWLTEGILSSGFNLEPVTYIAHLSAITTRLRFGIAVIILNTRNPVQLAKALATVDQLSNGRLIVGVGIGAGTANYPVFGVPPERRVARYEEAINIMKALWTEEKASLHGEFWTLNGARMKPKPVQKPHMPLIFGGHSEPALRRAVKMGDGWMAAGSTSTEKSLASLKQIRGYLSDAGRKESEFWLSKRLYIAVDENEGRAREKLAAALSYQYGGSDQTGVGLAATPARAVEVLGTLREAGAQHILLNPAFDHMQQMDVLMEKVIPQL
ncbi:MAG: LLM class flavin-dependent oxidoreductase [Betaproteobacteria bacterium]|nr:LLM class flavin-dependent oxidoreductase [Betaproteobacteria bacterium]